MIGTFERGLVEIGDGVFAYLQPDGTWGWSNAGLIVGSSESALVDTLFDLPLTQAMLDVMKPHTATRPIANIVNTHANGDHCYGNQLVAGPGVDVIASAAAGAEMQEVPAALLAAMVAGAGDDTLGRYIKHAFGQFDFNGIEPAEVTIGFRDHHRLDAGGRGVDLFEVGPAHTDGDVIAWMPDDRVLFAGDILFIEGTPIMWAGPLAGWVDAINKIVELEPEVIVPGHGPLTDIAGAVALRDYLVLLGELARERHSGGMSLEEATRDIDRHIDGTPYSEWSDRERIVVNLQTIWKELDANYSPPGVIEVFAAMAKNFEERGS